MAVQTLAARKRSEIATSRWWGPTKSTKSAACRAAHRAAEANSLTTPSVSNALPWTHLFPLRRCVFPCRRPWASSWERHDASWNRRGQGRCIRCGRDGQQSPNGPRTTAIRAGPNPNTRRRTDGGARSGARGEEAIRGKARRRMVRGGR
jgi:hypothetical protein